MRTMEEHNRTHADEPVVGAALPPTWPHFEAAMSGCDSHLLSYAAAHQAFAGSAPTGAAAWLQRQQPRPLTLHGALVVVPEHGGIGNVMRVFGQYAILGVLLHRAVFFELTTTLPVIAAAINAPSGVAASL